MLSTPAILAALAPSLATLEELVPEAGPSLFTAALGLLMGLIQLIVGLSIATFAINRGFAIVSRLLDGIDIWEEVKRRNIAVSLLAAGVVISYMRVIAGGIDAMTGGLQGLLGGELSAGLAAIVGGALNLVVAIAVASFAITVTFRAMDRLTPNMDEKREFREGNFAVGAVYCGILIGVSGLISAGVSGIGAAVGTFLSSLFRSLGF